MADLVTVGKYDLNKIKKSKNRYLESEVDELKYEDMVRKKDSVDDLARLIINRVHPCDLLGNSADSEQMEFMMKRHRVFSSNKQKPLQVFKKHPFLFNK